MAQLECLEGCELGKVSITTMPLPCHRSLPPHPSDCQGTFSLPRDGAWGAHRPKRDLRLGPAAASKKTRASHGPASTEVAARAWSGGLARKRSRPPGAPPSARPRRGPAAESTLRGALTSARRRRPWGGISFAAAAADPAPRPARAPDPGPTRPAPPARPRGGMRRRGAQDAPQPRDAPQTRQVHPGGHGRCAVGWLQHPLLRIHVSRRRVQRLVASGGWGTSGCTCPTGTAAGWADLQGAARAGGCVPGARTGECLAPLSVLAGPGCGCSPSFPRCFGGGRVSPRVTSPPPRQSGSCEPPCHGQLGKPSYSCDSRVGVACPGHSGLDRLPSLSTILLEVPGQAASRLLHF